MLVATVRSVFHQLCYCVPQEKENMWSGHTRPGFFPQEIQGQRNGEDMVRERDVHTSFF